MQVGLCLVYEEWKGYHQHRPAVEPTDFPERATLQAPFRFSIDKSLSRLRRYSWTVRPHKESLSPKFSVGNEVTTETVITRRSK
jgi:hypothetical protein